MDFLTVAVTGIIATSLMTLFTEIIATVSRKRFHVIQILGMMLQFSKHESEQYHVGTATYLIAVFVHYAIGIAFAFLYILLIDHQVLTMTLFNSVIFGCMIGLIGVTGWQVIFKIHPFPPPLNRNQYFSIVFFGHIILSLAYHVVLDSFLVN